MKLAWLFVGLAFASGCAQPDAGRDGEGPSATGTPTPYPVDCQPYGTGGQNCQDIILAVRGSAVGAFDVGVPYPHGAWCLQGDQWLAGERTPNEADVRLESTDRGQVLRLSGEGPFDWHARVIVDQLARCNTLRYDPWSIDPDTAEDKGVDVQVWAGTLDQVEVLRRSGGCSTRWQYEPNATVEPSWNLLPQVYRFPTACA